MKNLVILISSFIICYSLALPNHISAAEKYNLTAEDFTQAEWKKMDKNVQELEDNYLKLLKKTGVKKARQIVLQQAKKNPVFTGAKLSHGALSLLYKDAIPIILDLPDPNSTYVSD